MQSLNKIKTVGIEVGIKILAFAILTKLPDNFNSLIEKFTLNTKTQGCSDAILNLLHDAALKEEALKSPIESNMDSRMALNRETFTIAVMGVTILWPSTHQKNVANCIPRNAWIDTKETQKQTTPLHEHYLP
ncbi:hypothetical protein O181_099823 [Austropuccinia psidii MF-1]|uniref:Uncharacterized protein n=1 Tax=Austropuccinia psidii MF-1 TaxID=1389203 RepID=A0A9Q3JBM0_9BASI|nr:hypothetical protein [Austropuccinia psidii MF-1]